MIINTDQLSENTIPESLVIPDEVLANWRDMVDLMAEATGAAVALVEQVLPTEIKLLVCNQNGKVYFNPGDMRSLGSGSYSEEIVASGKELLVVNALADPRWNENPELKKGMVSCLGLPLRWPNGQVFGAVSVLDDEENDYAGLAGRLLRQYQHAIQLDLQVVCSTRLLSQCGQQEQNLSKNEKMYQAFFNNVMEGLAFIDFKGHFLDINPVYCNMLGYSKDELQTMTIPETLHPDNRVDFNNFMSTVQSGKVYTGEVIHVHKDGRLITAEVLGTKFKLNGKDCFLGAVRDISKRKQTELELEKHRRHLEELVAERTAELRQEIADRKKVEQDLLESEKLLKAIIDNSPVVIYVKDRLGRYTLVNRSFEEFFGVEREHFLGKTDQDVFPARRCQQPANE